MSAISWFGAFYTAMVYDSKQSFHRRGLVSFVAYNCLNPIFSLLSAWVAYTILQSVGATYFRGITGIASYMTFATIGLAFNGIIHQSAFGGFSAVRFEQWQGTLEPVIRTPASNHAWLFGKLVVGELFGFIPLISTLLFGAAIFGFQLASAPALGAAALAIVMMLVSMSVVSFVFGSVSVFVKDPTDAAILVTSFLGFFSGLVFPVSVLPPQVQWFSWILPSTYGVDVARKALLLGMGLGDWQVQYELMVMLAITLILLPISYLAFSRAVRMAERSGALDTG
jgi:ABC-type polysaccharide/polyol phosphate export permease